jgi:hypothetical protein
MTPFKKPQPQLSTFWISTNKTKKKKKEEEKGIYPTLRKTIPILPNIETNP